LELSHGLDAAGAARFEPDAGRDSRRSGTAAAGVDQRDALRVEGDLQQRGRTSVARIEKRRSNRNLLWNGGRFEM
jgi:hypothetical protein